MREEASSWCEIAPNRRGTSNRWRYIFTDVFVTGYREVKDRGCGKGEGVAEIQRFEDLVERHHGEIFAYILRMTRDRGEAEDLCQETFLRAYRAYDRLDGGANHRAWLYKIATNTTLNHIRRQKTGRRVIDTFKNGSRSTTLDDYAERAGNRDLLQRVQNAIDELPEKQRLALSQRKIAGLSYSEIADKLDCSEDAARANVYQAIRKLRQQFSAELVEVGI
ncbi:MAG: RNA polymerase sigma factor [Sphaerobacteraceae bacterium]|nr:MAG: RNA polymerase sigma factor [Sphaerobacteraceae bacterium]